MATKKSKSAPAAYEVGRGKPPRSSQFKPGQSGNPGGRRKGSVNLKTIMAAVLGSEIELIENGRKRKVPPVDMGAQVVRYHRWQIEQWAAALPPRLKQAQDEKHNPPIDKPAPFDGAEAAAEQRRQEALAKMRANLERKSGRGKAKVRSTG